MHMLEGESGIKLCNKVQDEAPEFRGGGVQKQKQNVNPKWGWGAGASIRGGVGHWGGDEEKEKQGIPVPRRSSCFGLTQV